MNIMIGKTQGPSSAFVAMMRKVVEEAGTGNLCSEASDLVEKGTGLIKHGKTTAGLSFCRAAVSCLRDLAKAAEKREATRRHD